MRPLCCLVSLLYLYAFAMPLPAQRFSAEEYRKALWMTTRMYGGQRSGVGPNWLIMQHGTGVDFTTDNDNGYDLSGGWHDCGDHVKFGQTQYYSAYVLLKAYETFPTAFDDHYSFDYRGYAQHGDFSWEGSRGVPDGIPDILNEVTYATDYFIKCARNNTTFYYQVGDGDLDHKHWVTSVAMAAMPTAEGGQPRPVFRNPAGSSMASFCSATLALMARLYRRFDSAYAERCLRHSLHAYEYAKANPGSAGSGFYPPNAKWQDDFVIMTTELYRTTGEQRFWNEAQQMSGQVSDHYWSLCYNNNDDLAAYNLGLLGHRAGQATLRAIVDRYKRSTTAEGVPTTGGQWGALRYSVSQSFAAALHSALDPAADHRQFIYNTVDYVMGANSASRSFIVGFGANSPQHPHHRNVFLDDRDIPDDQKNTLRIPQRNSQHGYMVGGSHTAGAFIDDINNYQFTEGGIDYNCGLVGTLAWIVSRLAPVDTSRFGGTPTLRPIPQRSSIRVAPASRIIGWTIDGRRFSAGMLPTTGAVILYPTSAGGFRLRALHH